MTTASHKTGVFESGKLKQQRCPDCDGTGELRFDSENINEHFEVEKQTVIAPCTRCNSTGFVEAG